MAKTKSALEGAVRLGTKNQITIPHRISKALRLKNGDHMLMGLVGRRLELVPIPKDQLWFWTPGWQKKEREADKDIAHGRVKECASADELMQDLES
jgi:antitoxin MazE